MPRLLHAVLCCCLTLLAACQLTPNTKSGDPNPASPSTALRDSTPDGALLKLAQLDSVQAELTPEQPPRAKVTLHGLLHDGATRVHEVQQQRLADGFVLSVVTARPKNAVATLALIPFERTVLLDLDGMTKGPCKIVANGVATTITVP